MKMDKDNEMKIEGNIQIIGVMDSIDRKISLQLLKNIEIGLDKLVKKLIKKDIPRSNIITSCQIKTYDKD
jgi:hypothetical protein